MFKVLGALTKQNCAAIQQLSIFIHAGTMLGSSYKNKGAELLEKMFYLFLLRVAQLTLQNQT